RRTARWRRGKPRGGPVRGRLATPASATHGEWRPPPQPPRSRPAPPGAEPAARDGRGRCRGRGRRDGSRGRRSPRATLPTSLPAGSQPIGSPGGVTAADVIRIGREEARTGPWRGDQQVAYLTPVPEHPAPSADFVRRCLDVLASRGFRRVVTGALSPIEQTGFLAAGFEVQERLHLLVHHLDHLPPRPSE